MMGVFVVVEICNPFDFLCDVLLFSLLDIFEETTNGVLLLVLLLCALLEIEIKLEILVEVGF